jgi:phage protein D
MNEEVKARRADVKISIEGVDISVSMREYLTSLTFTDNAEGESDDLQIRIADRDSVWLTNWLAKATFAASSRTGLKIHAAIVIQNWNNDGNNVELDCGAFELDSIDASGPPSVISLKGVSLPYGSQIRQTLKDKAWEGYNLRSIATEICAANEMWVIYESSVNPQYERLEQSRKSDIDFLSRLCKDAGISLKAVNNALVLFDQSTYEQKPPIMTITYGKSQYTKYKLQIGESKTQYATCRVRYTDPATGALIEGVARADDIDNEKITQQLEIWAKVASVGEAITLASKRLRLQNKFGKTASFTFVGTPSLVAGVTVKLSGFGAWDGKYIVQKAVHSIGSSGYTTQVTLRHVLEGY